MRALILLTALAGLVAICGCNGVARTAKETHNNAVQSMDLDARQLTEDWNMIWLVDRQYRLTRWHTR